jgi:hypothetical protein
MTPAELRALLAKATPGPWRIDHADWDRDEKRVEVFAGADGKEIVEAAYEDDYYDGIFSVRLEMSKADAAFLVAAVNALGPLLDVAEAASMVEDVFEHVTDAHEIDCPCSQCTWQRELRKRLAKLGTK